MHCATVANGKAKRLTGLIEEKGGGGAASKQTQS